MNETDASLHELLIGNQKCDNADNKAEGVKILCVDHAWQATQKSVPEKFYHMTSIVKDESRYVDLDLSGFIWIRFCI